MAVNLGFYLYPLAVLTTALLAIFSSINDRNTTHVGGMIASLTAPLTTPSHLKYIGVQHHNYIREL